MKKKWIFALVLLFLCTSLSSVTAMDVQLHDTLQAKTEANEYKPVLEPDFLGFPWGTTAQSR